MSGHTDDNSLEVIFGARAGDHFRFEVQGLICPDADEDWYLSQLAVVISVRTGAVSEQCSLVMFSDDFHRFKIQLKRVICGESNFASLETGDYLHVDLRPDGVTCNVSLQTDALERDDDPKFQLVVDRTSLDALLDVVTQVSDRYPTWSVPRQ